MEDDAGEAMPVASQSVKDAVVGPAVDAPKFNDACTPLASRSISSMSATGPWRWLAGSCAT
jgi:hypothetical protein